MSDRRKLDSDLVQRSQRDEDDEDRDSVKVFHGGLSVQACSQTFMSPVNQSPLLPPPGTLSGHHFSYR